MKPGTFLWAMEQLIAGNKVTRKVFQEDWYCKINTDGSLINQAYERVTLDYHDTAATDWIIWTPPVNYIPGTFPWAWEQLKAGKKVKVCEHLYSRDRTLYVHKQGEHFKFQIDGDPPYLVEHIHYTLINATDWELA